MQLVLQHLPVSAGVESRYLAQLHADGVVVFHDCAASTKPPAAAAGAGLFGKTQVLAGSGKAASAFKLF